MLSELSPMALHTTRQTVRLHWVTIIYTLFYRAWNPALVKYLFTNIDCTYFFKKPTKSLPNFNKNSPFWQSTILFSSMSSEYKRHLSAIPACYSLLLAYISTVASKRTFCPFYTNQNWHRIFILFSFQKFFLFIPWSYLLSRKYY